MYFDDFFRKIFFCQIEVVSFSGMIMPQYRVKIEDPETGERCGVNKHGEICLKSPFLMQRYLKRPKETEEFFDFEGFGHTGDIGYYDAEGNLIYVDRMKELIK